MDRLTKKAIGFAIWQVFSLGAGMIGSPILGWLLVGVGVAGGVVLVREDWHRINWSIRPPFLSIEPDIEFELDRQANLHAGGFDYLLRVWNHGPTKKFKATFTVPEGCSKYDRTALSPSQTYWWEKADSTVAEIHTGEEDFFRIANQRTDTLPESDSPHYPHYQFSLFRYSEQRDRPIHFCSQGYSPEISDSDPEVHLTVSVSSVPGQAHTVRKEHFVVSPSGVERIAL